MIYPVDSVIHFSNSRDLVFSVLEPAQAVWVPALLGPWWCVLEQDSWFLLCLHPPRTINGYWGIKYWEGTLWENWQPIKGEKQKAPSPFKSSLRASSLFESHARFMLGASRERIGAGESYGELAAMTEEFSFFSSSGWSQIPLGENDMHQSIFEANWNFRGECRNVLNRVPGGGNVWK